MGLVLRLGVNDDFFFMTLMYISIVIVSTDIRNIDIHINYLNSLNQLDCAIDSTNLEADGNQGGQGRPSVRVLVIEIWT